MSDQLPQFSLPPVLERADGRPRRVGFELEFSGIGLEDAARALTRALGGERSHETSAAMRIEVPDLGSFAVEIDWTFLKRKAEEVADGELP